MGLSSFFEEETVRRRLTASQQTHIIRRVGKCMSCGETDSTALEVHHIKPFSEGGSNKLWNLSVLCATCHKKAQRGTIPQPKALARKPRRKAPKRRRVSRGLLDW